MSGARSGAADFLPVMDDSVPRMARGLLERARAERARRGYAPLDSVRESEFLALIVEIMMRPDSESEQS